MPGAPFKASTDKPESSAITYSSFNLEDKKSAFIFAFPSKVLPVSYTSPIS